MARKRMISPNIWEDPTFNSISIGARLLFIGMISNADDDGYLRADGGSLKRLIFGFDRLTAEDVQDYLAEIEKFRSIHIYEVNGEKYGHFIKWKEYQVLRDDRRTASVYPLCVKCLTYDGQVPAEDKVSKGKLREVKVSKDSEPSPRESSELFFTSDQRRTEIAEALVVKGLKREFVLKEISAFVNYWAELTPSGKKQKWETEKTFEVMRRLAKWFSNAEKWSKDKSQGKSIISST